jgi:hypothetical protein
VKKFLTAMKDVDIIGVALELGIALFVIISFVRCAFQPF